MLYTDTKLVLGLLVLEPEALDRGLGGVEVDDDGDGRAVGRARVGARTSG